MRITYYKRGGIWYYRINEDGRRSTGKSTGQASKKKAEEHVNRLIETGHIRISSNPKFKDFAQEWWLWDECRYVRGKRARGARISERYCEIRRGYLERHVMPYFSEKRLSKITPDDIEDWLFQLKKKDSKYGGKLSNTTVNQILMTLKIMFREAARKRRITYDPTLAVSPLKEDRRQKTFPTMEELKKLFDEDRILKVWDGDLRMYTASLLAASTGMRMGEVQALRNQDVHPSFVEVNHSWSRKHGLHEPKYGSVRVVPIPSKVGGKLNELQRSSPYPEADSFVFWGIHGKKPINHRAIGDALYDAFAKIGIQDEDRRKRNITFHSWRYLFNSYFRTKVPDAKLRRLTGHRTPAMTERYTRFEIEDFADFVAVQEDML